MPSKPVLATPDFRVHPDIAQVGKHWKIGPCDLVSHRHRSDPGSPIEHSARSAAFFDSTRKRFRMETLKAESCEM